MLKSDVSGAVYGKTQKTERDPAEKVENLRKVFLDYSIKMKNPDFNTPTHTKHNRENVISLLQKMESRIIKAAKTFDLTETCLDFQMPQSGTLTRMEWIYFSIFHTQRHTRQLKNIHQKLESKKKETFHP